MGSDKAMSINLKSNLGINPQDMLRHLIEGHNNLDHDNVHYDIYGMQDKMDEKEFKRVVKGFVIYNLMAVSKKFITIPETQVLCFCLELMEKFGYLDISPIIKSKIKTNFKENDTAITNGIKYYLLSKRDSNWEDSEYNKTYFDRIQSFLDR
jgi:hypothetical protein